MRVRFKFPDGGTAETEAYDKLNILAHAQLVERSLQSRCGGHCECSTCRVIVRGGRVSPMREEERALLLRAGAAPGARLACQTFPEADGGDRTAGENIVEIDVPDERFVDARARTKRG